MIEFKLILEGFGRVFGGYPEIHNQSDLIAWKSAANLLNKFEFSENSTKILLYLNWSEITEAVNENYRIESMSKADLEEWKPTPSELQKSHKIYCKLDLGSRVLNVKSNINNICFRYASRAIYETFIILNLSSPGSFNFLKCRLETKASDQLEPSAFFFEEAWHQSLNNKWPVIKFIRIEKVINWVRFLKIGNVDFAKSKFERAIYALVHGSILPSNDLSTVIWISYALEALYETPVGQSFTVLFNRIKSFLSIPEGKNKKIKSQLREFYNERHKFAHGGAPIVHPTWDYTLDSEADKYLFKILELNSFAFSIALSTFQKCINESWCGFDFHEEIHGIPI